MSKNFRDDLKVFMAERDNADSHDIKRFFWVGEDEVKPLGESIGNLIKDAKNNWLLKGALDSDPRLHGLNVLINLYVCSVVNELRYQSVSNLEAVATRVAHGALDQFLTDEFGFGIGDNFFMAINGMVREEIN